MNKVLLTILIGCMGFISAHATTAISLEGKTRSIQESNYDKITPDPLHPIFILEYSFIYDSYRSALILFLGQQDQCHAVLENLSTGEHYFYSYKYGLL